MTSRLHWRTALAGVLLALGAVPVQAAAPAAPALPNPADYRRLDARQLGYLDWIFTVADRPGGDWSGMGHSEPGQGGFDSYRYQLAMMSYALDLANYHYVPAYRDLYQGADVKLIDKMTREDVWSFWEATSRGSTMFDPDLKELREGWIDPVREQDIMYSGHLFQMVATHAMLYGDDRYEKPDGIRLVYAPIGQGLAPQVFAYSTRSLADNLYKQFEKSSWRGIECEPNAIFPECNQHPILGFEAMEVRTPTGYFKTVSSHFKSEFDAMKYVDPKSSSFMAAYLKRQDKVLYNALPWSDGWAGAFMHGWAKADVERIYPIQKANYLASPGDGTLTVKADKPRGSYSHDHGFFTVLAAEVGDEKTRDGMLAYADRYWKPKWDAEGLRYPRQDEFKAPGDGQDVWRRVQVLTGNSLMALASIDVKDGLYDLYNRPRLAAAFADPFVSGVDYPRVKVARAVYDGSRKALIVTLTSASAPGAEAAAGPAAMTLHNLAADKDWGLWRDGQRIAGLNHGKVEAAQGSSNAVSVDSQGLVHVSVPLAGETTLIVMQEGASSKRIRAGR